jgi:hypothetical protein
MKYRLGVILLLFASVLIATVASASAQARTIGGDKNYVWDNGTIASDEEVRGDVNVVGGTLDCYGTIDGDVNVVFGTLRRHPGCVIKGDVNPVFGSDTASSWMPWTPFTAGTRTMAIENARLMTRLAMSVIVVLAFLIFPVRVRAALDRVEHHPGLSAAVGVLALVAVIPVAVILFISLIGWPLIPVEFIAIFAGMLIGQAALGLLVGRRLLELVQPQHTPSPLGALILGLVVISAAEILPVVGGLLTALLWLVGLGAAVLAFVRETTFGSPGAAGPGARPPIGGPPMTPA